MVTKLVKNYVEIGTESMLNIGNHENHNGNQVVKELKVNYIVT